MRPGPIRSKARDIIGRGWLPTARVLRRGIQPFLPPLVANYVWYAFSRNTYEPRGWTTNGHVGGWDRDSVAAAQAAHWPVLVQNVEGAGPLGVSHLPTRTTRQDAADHNVMMSYGYVLARVARNKPSLSVLDWGGGLGHYYLYSKALLPEVAIDYHCFDVPVLCELGRRLQPDAHFYEQENSLAGTAFDLVISSSSLHYFKDWRQVANTLVQRTGGFLYIARLMTVSRVPSFVVKQRSQQGYATEFLVWFLNRGETIEYIERLGMALVREFVYEESWPVKNAPEQGECRGFLFRRRE